MLSLLGSSFHAALCINAHVCDFPTWSREVLHHYIFTFCCCCFFTLCKDIYEHKYFIGQTARQGSLCKATVSNGLPVVMPPEDLDSCPPLLSFISVILGKWYNFSGPPFSLQTSSAPFCDYWGGIYLSLFKTLKWYSSVKYDLVET